MDFLELAKERYSVRKFADKTIEEEKMLHILKAGQYAPTAVNHQPQKIYLIKSDEAKEIVKKHTSYHFNAPVIIMMAYDKDMVYHNKLEPGYESGEMDCSIVLTHMMLAAWNIGLGSCWVRAFNAPDLALAFDLPENIKVVTLLYLGYPAEDSKPLKKLHFTYRPLEEMVEEL